MKTKVIIFMSSMLVMFSVVSCLKTIDDEVILPDKNEISNTNTQDITVPFAVNIRFSDGQTFVNNPFEGKGITVSVNRQDVTISSTIMDTEINYVLSGVTTSGSVKIYGDYRIGLVLNGVIIQNPTGAAINIQSSKRVSVTLVDNTSNCLIDEGKFQMTSDERMNGTLYSEGQLIFNGSGSLSVYGNYGHAICVRDYIRINSGNITVNHATSNAIHCRDYFEMNGGNLLINAKLNGVECTGGYVVIYGGTIKVNNSGRKGFRSYENLTIYGGKIEIESRDDGISANGNIAVTGGEIYCFSNKKGTVSNEGSIVISGGLFVSSSAKSVFECAKKFSITGGTAIGVGNATVTLSASECTQQTVIWDASKFTSGQLMSIKSSDNSEILTFVLPRAYSGNMALVYTSPLLQANTSYTIYKGGSVSGGTNFHGFYSNAVSSGGTAAATFTTSSMVTVVGIIL